jgi:hypothetical protein
MKSRLKFAAITRAKPDEKAGDAPEAAKAAEPDAAGESASPAAPSGS